MARGLGFVGAGGAAGMTDALKEIVAQRLLEKKLEDQRLQQEFENRMALRQADTGDSRFERTQGLSEELGRRGMAVSEGGLGLSRERFGHDVSQDQRGNRLEDEDRATAASDKAGRLSFLDEVAGGQTDPTRRNVVRGLKYNVQLPDLRSPEQRGTEAGVEEGAAFDAGGKRVRQSIVDMGTASGIAQSNAAAANAERRRVVTPPRQSAATTEKIAKLEQSVGMLDDMEATLNESWLGPIQGRATEASINMPGIEVGDDLAQFAAQTAALKNATIQAITGAAMGEQEAKRIMAQIPSFTDKPNVWRQKAAATRKNLELLADKMMQGQAAQGNSAKPGAVTSGAKLLTPADYIKKYGGGD